MVSYTATRDLYYHDVLVAKKGDTVTIDSDYTLINKARSVKILCCSPIVEGWMKEGSKLNSVDNSNDNVNHPKHYTSHPSGIECIEITRHYCFAIGNAIKYLWRAGLKVDASLTDKQKEIEDLEKAIWYIKDRIKQLKDDKERVS